MKTVFEEILIILVALLMIVATIMGTSAFSTLGLSKVDFNSNDASLASPAWLLTVVENGNSQYATGTFGPDQVKTSDGKASTNTMKLEITNTKNTCQYNFQNSNLPVYKVEMRPGYSLFTGANDCANTPGGFYYLKEPWTFSAYCYVKTSSGNINPLSTPNTIINSQLQATVGTDVVNGNINSASQRSVNLGSRVFAEWSGNLVSGVSCPNPSDSLISGAQVGGQFIIINKVAVDQYHSDQSDLLACTGNVLANSFPSHQSFVDCINAYNTKSNAVLTKTTISPWNSAVISGTSNSGQASFDLAQLVQFPVITLHVRADWIGINIPVGKPQITSVTSNAFSEGSNGNIRAVIKNIGGGSGTFTASASCTQGASQLGTAPTVTIAAGNSGIVDLSITGGTKGQSISSTCTVTAFDINQPNNVDSKSVTVTITAQSICTSGQQRCDSSQIQTCNNAGSQWVAQETCLNGCTAQNGVPTCTNAEACTKNSDCDDHDATTLDSCVGVIQKQCKHVVIPVGSGFDFGKYGKLLLFILLAIVFGVGATLLGKNVNKYWYGLHVITVIGIIGAIFGFFALFSPFTAFLFIIGVILILAGIGLFAIDLTKPAVILFILGLISAIGAIALAVTA